MAAERSLCQPEPDKPSTRRDVAVARLAGEQWGVLSLGELRTCGMSREAVNVRVRNGRLHPLHRGVYAVGHPRITLEGRFLAAVKACGPTAVLSHFSAAALYELLRWDDRYPEVTTTAQRTHHGIRVHRSSTLHAEDITRHRGIPVTTPARTAVDLAATLDYQPLRRVVRQALRLTTVNRLLATVSARGEASRSWPGSSPPATRRPAASSRTRSST